MRKQKARESAFASDVSAGGFTRHMVLISLVLRALDLTVLEYKKS